MAAELAAARHVVLKDGEIEMAERAVEVWLPLEALASGRRVVDAGDVIHIRPTAG